MIKISALNEESEEESGSEEEVTREASEQIALQQYANALELQRKGNLKDATQLLKDLLDTELLYEVQKPAQGEKMPGPLFNLKYLSYKNLATMLAASEEVDAAIEAYCAAAELDDTDVTLWHRLGQLCLRTKRYEMALHAFQRGAERNPRHWPCLDKIVTLLLGLDYKEECISTIHDALQLDPGYLRGLAYRKHIYTVYPYIKDFMEYLNPIYKWDEKDDEPFDEEKAKKLINEAELIHDTFIEQQRAEQFKYVLPELKLVKPVSSLSWKSVGDSLVHMHHYMTENCYSHACKIELIFEKEDKQEAMEVCEEPTKEVEQKPEEHKENKIEEAVTEPEKNVENVSENENNDLSDKDKTATDTEKVESDVEMVAENAENPADNKQQKKAPVRRRGSALSFLEMWEWCTKRRSGRKKPANKQEQDDNIYETLRRMVPISLVPELVEKKENQARDTSPDVSDLDKLFDAKDKPEEVIAYFGSDDEQKDVKNFINQYTEQKRDIIDILNDFLNILACKWREKWPKGLSEVFIDANKCYLNHIDVPTCTSDNDDELLHFTTVNILAEEFLVNEKLNKPPGEEEKHELSVIETIGIILNLKPNIFKGSDCLDFTLRYLWVKLHIQLLNKCNEFALDCLYQLVYEFEAMGEHHDKYNLDIVNFTHKPKINESEVLAAIKDLERNKKLSTVMELYDKGNYEEVLSIVIDSFEHCKAMAKVEEQVALDFAVHLAVILDTYWALDRPEECFKWSLICLHEALNHYFRFTTGSPEYDKWTLTVVKILCCMDHILTTEGLTCLDTVSQKELSQGLEDLIRVIGHQVETNAAEMPFGTVIPWIIVHYILQREEDQGRARIDNDKAASDEDVPNPLMVLFIAHEQLGKRGWCCKSEGKLLYFTLDTVVPRLRSPSLAKSLEQVVQFMEQCVFCLFGHPGRKNKLKYLVDHNVPPYTLDWKRAQQLYEIFRPPTLPALEGKLPGITADTEQLFHKILALLPPECDPQKYLPDIDRYIKGLDDKLPHAPSLLPYKMKDIYFLLGDYYYKREESKLGIKFNMLDVALNNDRVESWARISLAKSVNLERMLNSCKNLNHEREFLNPAKSVIRCYKKCMELDPTYCNMWTEYGMFAYYVHSFCSRVLKQASESLSMEDFESLEKLKEDMLDITYKSFITVQNELNNSSESDKVNDESWLHFYMLGKVSEKRNKPPSLYLDYYMKAVKSLQESNATYPSKINYSTPTHLCVEVLELHYRIHASILKYIEQHENKPIPASVGKVFSTCIEDWKKGPFTRKSKKDGQVEMETNTEPKPAEPVHAANILKRSISDAGEEESHEAKRLKMEAAAAKVRRSASYDTERKSKEPIQQALEVTEAKTVETTEEKKQEVASENLPQTSLPPPPPPTEPSKEVTPEVEKPTEEKKDETDGEKKEESSSTTSSSSSSSDSSSSETSSDSSSDSTTDSDASKSSNDAKPISDDELMKTASACLDALEDCASRFPPHYKAIYRLAHYHFYYKKGKDVERCRDLMLSTFTSRSGHKMGGLFGERKPSNFFNNIWRIPTAEVDRPGSFTFHMNRSVLLTMEILKEIDDHKTLLDLSIILQKIPELDKKYVRDSDREELAQQAFSLCIQSLKGQLIKFSQQADLKINEVERQALNSFMLDIYRAYLKVQKQPNAKQFTNLLVEGYKLLRNDPIPENINVVDLSLKYCHKMLHKIKNDAMMASVDKSQNAQKKQAAKAAVAEVSKAPAPSVSRVESQPKPEQKAPVPSTSAASSTLPKMSPHEMAAAFQNYLPTMLNDPVLSQQTAAALSLSYLSNMNVFGAYPSLQNTLQNTLQNSFQAEFYRQFLGQSFSSFMPPVKKQKRGPKPGSVRATNPQMKSSKSFTAPTMPSTSKAVPTPVISSLQKSNSTPITPSMGSVLQNLPASMSANLSSFPTVHSSSHSTHSMPAQAHMSTASTVNAAIHTKPPMPHQQVSPGKTLQEKLAERQKHLPISKNHEINASISKLPSSLTITKTSVPKPVPKKPDAKKQLPFTERPKPITSDEVIVLDDD